MPIYSYVKNDGKIVEKIYLANKAPDTITLQDGQIAKKIITVCMFGHVVHNENQQDQKKRDQQQRQHMMDYNVQFFNPLKGQSKQQSKKDFQEIKNKLNEQMIQKKQLRKKINQEKKQKNKKTYKQTQKKYFKMLQERKDRQFQSGKLFV